MLTQKSYNIHPGAAYWPTTKITCIQTIVPTTPSINSDGFCLCVPIISAAG